MDVIHTQVLDKVKKLLAKYDLSLVAPGVVLTQSCHLFSLQIVNAKMCLTGKSESVKQSQP